MTTDKTPATLATVKHGGCVQLPTSERARFEACAHAQSYRGGNILTDRDADHPDVYADPLAQLAWKIWQAALSAQPSPGGQGDAVRHSPEDYRDARIILARNMKRVAGKHNVPNLAADADVVESGEEYDFWMDAAYDAVREALAARQPVYVQGCDELRARTEGERAAYMEGLEEGKKIAARQPVGEPVAVEIPQGAIINGAAFADRLEQDYQFECPAGPLVNCTDYVEFRRCFDFLAQWASSLPPLFAAPPAQAVDLGLQLDRYDAGLLGDGGGGDIGWWQDYIRTELDRAHEFYQDQADSQAVGK